MIRYDSQFRNNGIREEIRKKVDLFIRDSPKDKIGVLGEEAMVVAKKTGTGTRA